MDALTFLRQDHKSVLGMLEVLDDASRVPAPNSAAPLCGKSWPTVSAIRALIGCGSPVNSDYRGPDDLASRLCLLPL